MKGTYRYSVRRPAYFGTLLGEWEPEKYTRHTLRVEVLETIGDKLRIKFTDFHEDGRGPGTITTVKATSVTIDAPVKPTKPGNVTPAPGIDREIRLPYKDD